MLGMKKQPQAVPSAIGVGVRLNGDCIFEGVLQLDGAVFGSVTGQGNEPTVLIIGELGSIEGAVSADHVVIAGSVVGPVLARDLLELHTKASVRGDVRYKALEMQRGAVVAGQLQPQAALPATTSALPQVELVETAASKPLSKSKPAKEAAEPTLEPSRV